ncbi:MAG: TolC family outer membrane protein [Alphaproteobacteria bacterium]|nr:TolC family outer membrane protein [Alphaproteobacteria bacterium]
MISRKTIRVLCLTTAVSAALALGSVASYAEEGSKVLSLRDALATGLALNPEYGAVAASRRATDEELNQGKALFLPSVDANADAGYERTDNSTTRATTTDGETNLWRNEAGVTLTQMLFDGWDSHYEVQRQQARVESSAYRVKETSELVGLSIVEAYLDVLRQRQLLEISRKNVSDHISILEQIKQGVDAGRSTQADLEQAKARLAAARSTESSTRQSLRNAEAEYRKQTGDAPDQLGLPLVPYESLAADVEEEVRQTLDKSPTLEVRASDIEVAYAEAQKTKSSYYPQVDLQLNARSGNDLSGVKGHNSAASALVIMNWNLYRGGADVARAREFNHRHQEAKSEYSKSARAVENDVRQTWASMVSAGERASQFTTQAEANSEVVKAYRDQFSLDRRTLLDVLDAQNELFVSRSSTVNSEFLEMFAVYRLLALKGALLPTIGVEYPRESAMASGEQWSYKERQKAR